MTHFSKNEKDKNTGLILTFTSEVMELRKSFHDDADEGQVQHGHSGLHLRVGVAGVRVVAGQQVVDDAHHLFVEAKHPAATETKPPCFSGTVRGTTGKQMHTHTMRRGSNSQRRPAYLLAAETVLLL